MSRYKPFPVKSKLKWLVRTIGITTVRQLLDEIEREEEEMKQKYLAARRGK